MKPVIAAAASCHTPNPRGIRRTAKGDARDARMDVSSIPSSTASKCQLKVCITCTTQLHTRMMVAALMIYAFARSIIEKNARFKLGAFHLGSSMMKKDFLYLYPVIALTRSAPRKISTIPRKYDTVLTQPAPAKNAPAKSAITGILAPQGMKVVSMADALLSLSSRMVRQAMIAGIPQPVPMMMGMMALPDKPTRLKIGSITAETLAI